MKAGQRIVVRDQATDDFGTPGNRVHPRVIGEDYAYRHGFVWQVVSAIVYYVIAPIPVFVMGFAHGLRFVNRSALRRAGGGFIFCNHTHWLDTVIPYLTAWPRRAYVIAGPTAFSIRWLGGFVAMLGGLPLNSTEEGKAAFRARVQEVVGRGAAVAVYPEAHQWPYYNGIRDFPAYAFTYPVHCQAPVIASVVTYRRRRFFPKRAPHMTVTLSEPIWPSTWQDTPDPKAALREAVHSFMCDTVTRMESYAWVEYVTADGLGHSRPGPVD